MSRLKHGKPRRFPDHRRLVAKRYNEAFDVIAERYPPQDRLASRLVGVAADLLVEYEQSRTPTARVKASARRKTIGLLLGALRAARNGAGGRNGHEDAGADLLARLAALPKIGAEQDAS
jgi:hypothetical protein